MLRKYISIFLMISLIYTAFSFQRVIAADIEIKAFDDVRLKDLTDYDLSTKSIILPTLTFDSDQKWPSKDKLPKDFDPQKIIEWGKDPGLGIKKLHEQGYTGRGVNVAYIDQPLLLNHIEYKESNIRYYKIRPKTQGMDTSMHGPSVLSLLAGKDIGVAPDSTVYFFGHPAYLTDQRAHAEALRKLIEVNKGLPDDKKIKVVGFSDSVDESEKYPEEFRKAIKEAETSGIMVITVNNYFKLAPLYVSPLKDKDNINNYEIAQWAKDWGSYNDSFFVPSSGRTTATGIGSTSKYSYWSNGGLSWTVPYVVGVIALGLQADQTLTKENIVKYLNDSSIPYLGGKIINPEGFIHLVQQNNPIKKGSETPNNSNYFYILYNSGRVTSADFSSIQAYADKLAQCGHVILKDTKSYNDAASIYDMLKSDWQTRNGILKGIQIIGIAEDVPTFDIHFKIQMQDTIDDSGNFKSDFFYSNFNNNSTDLRNDFSIYKAFNGNLGTDFISDWTVSRLPLTSGEISKYVSKYDDFVQQTKGKSMLPLVNFSNPIFPSSVHEDDMGYFIINKLDKEYSILNKSQYRLYGNKDGYYPVTTDVDGGYTKDNIKAENQKEIVNFFINSHGQENNIDQAIFTGADAKTEKRISFLNSNDINSVLNNKYYNLITWTCLNGNGLGENNIVHTAMSDGKCISSMAASSIISNNGVHNKVNLDQMKKNNFYYFQYVFFDSLNSGCTLSESFSNAQRAYAQEILKNTDILGDGNYQFNLHNVLSYHFFGLIEYLPGKTSGFRSIGENKTNIITSDGSIVYTSEINSTDLKVESIKATKSNYSYKLIIKCKSGTLRNYCVFNPPNGDKIRILGMDNVKTGDNTISFEIKKEDLENINEITVNIFNDEQNNYIFFYTDQLQNCPNETQIPADESNIKATSQKYNISQGQLTISIGKSPILLSKFKSNITIPKGATIQIFKSDEKSLVITGYIISGMKLKLTSKDKKTSKIYRIIK